VFDAVIQLIQEVSFMKVQFQTVDVFTNRQFGGNPLAVIPDARDLSDAQMHAIANEFNLAETTFVLPPDDPANTARVRIFTPRAEMPFAGHPNVGTAFVLAQQDAVCGVSFDRRNMVFEEIAGLVRMTIDSADGRMFAPLHGVFEDPATGSANVALIGLLAHLRREMSLRLEAAIGQGIDLGRPSLMRAVAEKADGIVTGTFIGGSCKPAMFGWIDLQ
jgi:predicted PhzF superfamily epimerase YddE/YHI9